MTKPFILPRITLPVLIGLSLTAIRLTGFAQNVERISRHEIAKRQAQQVQGEDALALGKQKMREKDYAAAHDQFRIAVNDFHDSVVSAKAREEAIDGFTESGIKLAK